MHKTSRMPLPRWNPGNPGWARIVLFVIALALIPVAAPLNVGLYKIPVMPGLLLAALHSAALLLTALRPGLGQLISLVVIGLIPLLAEHGPLLPLPFTVAGMLTQLLIIVVAGLRAMWAVATFGALATLGVAAVVSSYFGHQIVPNSESTNMVVFASISFGLLIAAIVARQWQEIRGQLRVERAVGAEESARLQLVQERARIARELHDVVAHGMSLVTVQATTARYRYPQMTEDVAGEFEDIAANSRRAMTEMRSLLGALRGDDGDTRLMPQPSLGEVPELIDSARKAGITVEVPESLPLDDTALSPVLGLAVYRIIQEALSNVIRHAPGSSARVEIARDESMLQVVVSNSQSISALSGQNEETRSAGHGLVGMRERAQILGGTLAAGRSQEGGFRVEARFPLLGHPDADETSTKGHKK
ncbi:MAG: sensor histidine kinase [Acidobacteria bacterium]|nr:sensor histidine kinase [Acidobacteriota bacterium]